MFSRMLNSKIISNYDQTLAIIAILFLALVRGTMYASFMPPWGLIDEQQHMHYIQHLAEYKAIPIVGQTFLSEEIINSIFQTRRHEAFHWPTPTSQDPQKIGLEGHSYEGYQPPLFYILFVPLYTILPDDILTKVYGLRWGVVGLSLLTVWFTYRTAIELLPQHPLLPLAICLLLILIPERTMSVSRVNNDVLLEVIATAFVWVSTRSILRGLSIRRAQLLGLFLGFGILVKSSMIVTGIFLPFVFWINRRNPYLRLYLLWTCGVATVLILPLIVRNWWLYGDLTGFSSFSVISNFNAPELTGDVLISGFLDIFRHFWVVWWSGGQVTKNPLLNGLYLVLALISAMGLAKITNYMRHNCRQKGIDKIIQVVLMYMTGIAAYAIAILTSYFTGRIPIIQGRFLLPVVAPIVILFGWGIWQSRHRKSIYLITVSILVIIDTFSLFGNLMPYFYYWSAFVQNGIVQSYTPLAWQEACDLFFSRFLSDKPASLQPILIWIVPLYIFTLLFTILRLKRAGDSSTRFPQLTNPEIRKSE